MTKEDLKKIRQWADDKIATGEEPPWAWFQYMKLRETLDAILGGMDSSCIVTVPADLQSAEERRGNGHLRLVDTSQQGTSPPAQSEPEVLLPM